MSYLLAGQRSEIERLRVQSRVWEPAGERLLASLGLGSGQRVLDGLWSDGLAWLSLPLGRRVRGGDWDRYREQPA